MSDQQAENLTTLSTIVATFDASVDTNPTSVGWTNDSAGSESGILITDQNQAAWQANKKLISHFG